ANYIVCIRAVGQSNQLKMKASRFIFGEISQNLPIMPFSARITSHALQELQPTKTLDEEPEIMAWLALGTKSKKKGGKQGDKAEESTEAEPIDATTASQEC
ncbi:hypothetical protein MKW92_029788, partial [Papaver armeniacum]